MCFTLLDTELDLLELRIRELADVVDKVVVFESAHTSTGRAKDRYFERAKKHFDELYPVRRPARARAHRRTNTLARPHRRRQGVVLYYGTEDLEIDSWKGHIGFRGVPNERLSWARNEMCACSACTIVPRPPGR